MNLRKNILTVILCAGEGTRIKEYSSDVPKPLIRIENMSILEVLLNSFYQQGVKKVALVKGHLGHKIDEFANDFRRIHKLSSSDFIVIDSVEDYKLGPLHSFLSVTKNAAVFTPDQSYIVIPGDVIFDSDLLEEIIDMITKIGNDNPIIFYREVNIDDLNQENISIVYLREQDSTKLVKQIVQINIKNFSGDNIVKQIIPLFFSNYKYIENILQFDQVKSINTLRKAINISINKGFRIKAVNVQGQTAFYDIDNKSDLEEYKKKK